MMDKNKAKEAAIYVAELKYEKDERDGAFGRALDYMFDAGFDAGVNQTCEWVFLRDSDPAYRGRCGYKDYALKNFCGNCGGRVVEKEVKREVVNE